MAFNPQNSNGQKTMANSAPVVLSSDQASIPITLATAPTTPVTGTFWQATQPVSLATNTPTLATGANIVGKVGIDQTTPGTTNLVALAANQSINNAQINGVTPLMGNGATGTGSQRVTVASDNTPFPIKIDQTTPGTTNLVALAANQSVNAAQINGVTPLMGNGVTGTGSQRVTVASDNTPFPIKLDQTTVGTTNAVSVAQLGANTIASGNGTSSTGTLRVAIASDNTANSNPFLTRHAAATTSSGLLNAKILAAATTNATSVKGSAAAIYGWHFYNNATAARYVRIFNKATAPTMGTDSPIFVLPLPAGGGAVMTPATMNFALGTGFAYAITGAAADLDATAVTANDVVGTIWYI